MFFRKKSIKDIDKLDFIVVMGSGYTDVLNKNTLIEQIPYTKIKEALKTTVSGHKGILEIRNINNKKVAILRGRSHMYEGYTPSESTKLIREFALAQLKIGANPIFILTNASGSTHKELAPGDIVIIKDHINTIWRTPLSGANFIDMTEAYDKSLIEKMKNKASKVNINIKEGVYAITPGPQYETPAEVKMMKTLGADLLGMSTVPEIIQLQALGIKTLALSIVSNFGTGVSNAKLSHKEVSETVNKSTKKISKLLEEFISD